MVTLSVVLPTYGRGFIIEKFLGSLLSQSYHDWELIIVADASGDNTFDILSKYVENNKKIRLKLSESHQGLPVARNIGVALAKGELIFFGEDDITFCAKDTLEILVKTFYKLNEKQKIGAIGPRVRGSQGYQWLNTAADVGPVTGHLYHNFSYNTQRIIEVPALHSCSVISRSAFKQVGGFDEKLYPGTHAKEEVDFYYRLRKYGYKLFFEPNSLIFHDHASTGGCESRRKLRRYYFETRNSLLFFARFDGLIGSCRFLTLPILRKAFPRRVL
jgi:GT2 family glycosyltransferase